MTSGLINTDYNNVGFSSTDIRENVTRPSFYIEFDSNTTGLFNANNKERNVEVKIYYFPKDKNKYKLELMDVQEYLSKIFLHGLKISEDFFININEIDFDTVDDVLISSLELYLLEDIQEYLEQNENQENMEILDIN